MPREKQMETNPFQDTLRVVKQKLINKTKINICSTIYINENLLSVSNRAIYIYVSVSCNRVFLLCCSTWWADVVLELTNQLTKNNISLICNFDTNCKYRIERRFWCLKNTITCQFLFNITQIRINLKLTKILENFDTFL